MVPRRAPSTFAPPVLDLHRPAIPLASLELPEASSNPPQPLMPIRSSSSVLDDAEGASTRPPPPHLRELQVVQQQASRRLPASIIRVPAPPITPCRGPAAAGCGCGVAAAEREAQRGNEDEDDDGGENEKPPPLDSGCRACPRRQGSRRSSPFHFAAPALLYAKNTMG